MVIRIFLSAIFITIYTMISPSVIYATTLRVDSFTAKCHPKSKFLSEGEHCLTNDCSQKVVTQMYYGGKYRISFFPTTQNTISPTENDLHSLHFPVFSSFEQNLENSTQNILNVLENFCTENIGSISDILSQRIKEWVADTNRCGDLDVEPYSREKEKKLFDENQTSPYCYYKYHRVGNWFISSYILKGETPKNTPNIFVFPARIIIPPIIVLVLLFFLKKMS